MDQQTLYFSFLCFYYFIKNGKECVNVNKYNFAGNFKGGVFFLSVEYSDEIAVKFALKATKMNVSTRK